MLVYNWKLYGIFVVRQLADCDKRQKRKKKLSELEFLIAIPFPSWKKNILLWRTKEKNISKGGEKKNNLPRHHPLDRLEALVVDHFG